MASVTYSNAKKYRYLGQDEEEPEEYQGDTLRQKILKDLLKKQLSKHISLEQQLHNQKKFVRSICEESVTANTSGLASFEDFKSVESLLNVKQTLKSCDLTESEIHLLLGEESQSSHLEAPHARRQRLEAIENKIVHHRSYQASLLAQNQTSSNALLDDTQRVSVSGEASQPTLQQDFLPEGHPMNHLTEIAESLFPPVKSDKTHGEEHIEKKRQRDETVGPAKLKKNKNENPSCIYLTEKPKSYWDMQQIPKIIRCNTNHPDASLPQSPGKSLMGRSCERGKTLLHVTKTSTNVKVDQTKPFVMSLDPEDLIPLATINANKISIQELKDMEKFRNYNEGTPSSTLFIKNLSPSITPKDLASLMGHFESTHGQKILYRLLGGRMKGQAFVTFPDEEAASSALRLCTGYMLHGKPLVAVFAKKL
ncbi:RNA-binding protein 41-like [Portunus trituberculatus]|uniref:RNA-binding protein 41-like n=1 Tax=Portunus trituberculatus TaxID=210409 RepID=UPI001E1CC738|nr:RNA-binding protein 41-like [Portunus trituberculatus]